MLNCKSPVFSTKKEPEKEVDKIENKCSKNVC